MRPSRTRRSTIRLLFTAALLVAAPAGLRATCGGGGGGGVGGFTDPVEPGMERVYHVPWKVIASGETAPTGKLVLYWFPTSPDEARASSLVTSRRLSVWSSSRCSIARISACLSTTP